MKRRFVISLQSSTTSGDHKFKEYLAGEGVAWWHWMPNFWLLVDMNDRIRVEAVSAFLRSSHPAIPFVVLEFRGDGTDYWAGVGPANPAIFDWFKSVW